MEKEIWRPIKGYIGFYEVSNMGRVKSLSKIINTNRKKDKKYRYTQKPTIEIILKPIIKTTGYQQITLSKNRKQERRLIHRLVIQAFLENKEKKPQANHIDGDKANNKLDNLEWCTASENGLHSYRVLKNKAWSMGKTGKDIPSSKAIIQKSLDGKIIKKWECGLDVVRSCNFDSSGISRCCNGINKSHKGFKWEFDKK